MKQATCWLGALVLLTTAHARAEGQNSLLKIRKVVVTVEEIRTEGPHELAAPVRRATALAVIANPYAGRYVEDLSALFPVGAELGKMLADRAVQALGIRPEDAESYGKAGIVGTNGEVEHLAAILHPQMGAPIRVAVGGGTAIIPSAVKRGAPGATIDVPLHFKNDPWLFSYIDAVEVRVPDAPAPDEIVIAVAVTTGRRPGQRIGDKRVP